MKGTPSGVSSARSVLTTVCCCCCGCCCCGGDGCMSCCCCFDGRPVGDFRCLAPSISALLAGLFEVRFLPVAMTTTPSSPPPPPPPPFTQSSTSPSSVLTFFSILILSRSAFFSSSRIRFSSMKMARASGSTGAATISKSGNITSFSSSLSRSPFK